MATARILIAIQHLLGRGLQKLLEGEFFVVGVAENASAAAAHAVQQAPDILLLDSSFLHGTGTAIFRRVRSQAPRVKRIVLTEDSDQFAFSCAAQFGAAGVIAKQQSLEDLLAAVRMVARGQRYICPQMLNKLPWVSPCARNAARVEGSRSASRKFCNSLRAGKQTKRLLNFSVFLGKRQNFTRLLYSKYSASELRRS